VRGITPSTSLAVERMTRFDAPQTLPPHDQMTLEELSEAEGADFLAAVDA
jgi:hypothetical protein